MLLLTACASLTSCKGLPGCLLSSKLSSAERMEPAKFWGAKRMDALGTRSARRCMAEFKRLLLANWQMSRVGPV